MVRAMDENAPAATEVRATRFARRYIERRGGDLYVWFQPLGPDLFQHVSTRRPDGVRFRRIRGDGITVYLQRDFDPPKKLDVSLLWPLGVEVHGTGVGALTTTDGSGGDEGSGHHWPGGHGDSGGGGGHGGHGGGGHH